MDIHIDWEGPFTLGQALQLNKTNDFGLYQFYGDHVVYGSGVLLYIGMTDKQTFGKRIAQHNWQIWIPTPVSIYVGRFHMDREVSKAEREQLIAQAENILLFSHSPAFNTSKLNTLNITNKDVRVLNWGMRKSLLPEASVLRWEGGKSLGHNLPENLIMAGKEYD